MVLSALPILSKCLVLAAMLIYMTACSPLTLNGENGEEHHIILGFGVVTTKIGHADRPVEAIRSHSLGLYLSTGRNNQLGAGYAFSARTLIPNETKNFCAEIEGAPFGSITITSCEAFTPEKWLDPEEEEQDENDI